jgi:hypothetical protein
MKDIELHRAIIKQGSSEDQDQTPSGGKSCLIDVYYEENKLLSWRDSCMKQVSSFKRKL